MAFSDSICNFHILFIVILVHRPFIWLFYREVNSFDMRKKLPFCVGLLLRLLKKNHRVYVTCTTGFDRSPACVIAYLHWMTDTSLHAAYSFVTGLHTCRPDRYYSIFFSLQLSSYKYPIPGVLINVCTFFVFDMEGQIEVKKIRGNENLNYLCSWMFKILASTCGLFVSEH